MKIISRTYILLYITYILVQIHKPKCTGTCESVNNMHSHKHTPLPDVSLPVFQLKSTASLGIGEVLLRKVKPSRPLLPQEN